MAYLPKTKQDWIDSVIANIKSSIDDEYYPLVGLAEMAQSLGIKVYEDDLTPISGSLSGFITYDDPKKKTNPKIFIEKTMSSERKRFTLAHELGHHFLHEGVKLRLDNLDYSASGKDVAEETEANYFAASLLIPRDLLTSKLEQNLTVSELADYFQVSLSAMKNRIKWVESN